ncbi:peptidoglycan DD-metalloendopeptidase family protein [Cohnella sp. CFH 77786]|uniref:M23 family metallopeptidase n=1 Tax=Cohnella sp. CFH 77786 TaxID=2662265 RepID=UPI001C609EFE|nr:M23 family metallopeptidase [Cohnella sp. CFH 77786]MBW5448758.1 peptidoglycan DD-metalloendopeptidase family protein [Cohnella sp. CFH 77786]
MAVFRGTDRIRSAAAAAMGSLRHVRSYCLKGITIVNQTLNPKKSRFIRQYRKPIAATAVALLGVGAVAIGGQQYVEAHTNDYFQVYVKGTPVGQISDKTKVERWLAAKAAELNGADTPVLQALDEDQVTYQLERAYKASPDDEATLAALAARVTTHPVGVELKVNGKVVGVVRDREAAEALLAKVKKKYVPEAVPVQATANKPAPQIKVLSATAGSKPASAVPERKVTRIDFAEKVDLAEVKLTGGVLSDPDKLYKQLVTGNPTAVKYTVKEGDCLGCIAEKFNVSPELIYRNNPWIVDDMLHIGDVLDLTELKPVLNVHSEEQVTQTETVEAPIEYRKSEDMRAGESKVIRQGRDGKKRVTYRLVKKNGSLLEEEIVSETLLEKPVSTIILKGTKVIAGEGTGKFAWPVIGHRVTSYLGMRWGRMHNGIDIVGRSSILAADNGVVEFAGYKSGGLGNMIIIDHKNGFKTVYGHMKSLKVKKGQIVEKGDTIGIMGSTGHSTGTHLHFEIHLDGKLKNPLSYL